MPAKYDLSRRNEIVASFRRLRDMDAVAKEQNVIRETVRKHLKAAGESYKGLKPITDPADEMAASFGLKRQEAAPATVAPEPIRLDIAEKHRFEKNEGKLKAQVKTLTARLVAAEDHRNSILGLTFERVEPICAPMVYQQGERGRQAPILQLSDLHFGEVVNSEEMMGVNKFNLEIAQKRTSRYFETATILTTTAWPKSDGAPWRVYVLLGGDLVSGHGLHPELAETDAGTAYEQCKWAATSIAAGALRLSLELKEHYGIEIEIVFVSVGGNHGRMTFGKPRSKLAAIQSYDTLVVDFIEAALKTYGNFKFYTPRAFDAHFDVVGWPCLLTHGDRMSAGGGTGFIGPAANIVKGHKKMMITEAQQRRPVKFIFSGHFHTRLVTPWGFANSALVGYSEFAKSIRADAEPASQNYIVLHERLGLLREQPIIVGRPDEGSIYSPTGGLILPHSFEN